MLTGKSLEKSKSSIMFAGAYLVTACISFFISAIPFIVLMFWAAEIKSIEIIRLHKMYYYMSRMIYAIIAGRITTSIYNIYSEHDMEPHIQLGKIGIDLIFLGHLTGLITSIVILDILPFLSWLLELP